MNKYINLIVPESIKKAIINQASILPIHFYTKEEIYQICTYSYDDNQTVKYAIIEKLNFLDAKKELNLLSKLIDKIDENYSNKEIELFKYYKAKKDKAINLELLTSQKYKLTSLKNYETYIYGYANLPSPLTRLLKENSINYTFLNDDEFSKVFNVKINTNSRIIKNYKEVSLECFLQLNSLIKNIVSNEKFNSNDYLIVCPNQYIPSLIQHSNLFNLVLNYPTNKIINLESVRKIIDDFSTNLDVNYLKNILVQYDNNLPNYLQSIFDSINKILNSISFGLEKDNKLTQKIVKQYLEFKSQASYQKDKYYDGIKVSTSLDSASFKKHLYILGLNDNLISSSKDNDLIADKYKENLSYLETSYIKDQNKIKNLETLVKLSSNVNLSFSLSDPLNNYSISNLLPNNIKHEHDSNSNLIISEIPNQNFELIGSTYNLNNSASIDKNLAFYAGIHNERAKKINENDAFFKYIISQHNYNLTNYISSYTNQFKAKDNTIFKNMFAYNKDGKNFSISHSSLDCYLNDPFDFYCKYVLKLPSKSTPQTLIGTIAHTLIEKRNKSIDFEEEFNSALNKLSDKSLEGYSVPEIKYFAKKAYLNAKNYIIPGIVDFETTTNFKQLFINDGEEFSFNYKLEPTDDNFDPILVNGSIDSIFINEDSKKAIIIDFKTSSNPGSYFNKSKNIFGRLLQLPFYSLFFNLLKDKYPKLKDYSLLGAYILSIYEPDSYIHSFKIKGGANTSHLLNGFSLFTYEQSKQKLFTNYSSFIDGDDFRFLQNTDEIKLNKIPVKYSLYLKDIKYKLDKLTISNFLELDETENKVIITNLEKSIKYIFINIALLELVYMSYHIRNGFPSLKFKDSYFPIFTSYYKNTPIDSYQNYKDISFADSSQKHQIYYKDNLDNLKQISYFNDFQIDCDVDYSQDEEDENIDDKEE